MGYDLTNVLVYLLFSVAFVVVTVSVLSYILRPRAFPADEPAKGETYECGEPAIGSSWVRFDIRFYTVALIFIIFDVEVAFLYPWGVIFEELRRGGAGLFVFLEMFIFVAILVVGLIYCWRKGDLDWVKSSEGQVRKGETVLSPLGPPVSSPLGPPVSSPLGPVSSPLGPPEGTVEGTGASSTVGVGGRRGAVASAAPGRPRHE